MTLSDRIAVMNEGRIEQIGPPKQIYREPATEFVAEFIGDTNLLQGRIVERGGRTVAVVGDPDGNGFTVPVPKRELSGSVTVSVRPEDFVLVHDGEGAFEAEVVEHFFQGDQTNYRVDPGLEAEEIQISVQGRERNVEVGETVAVDVVDGAPSVF